LIGIEMGIANAVSRFSLLWLGKEVEFMSSDLNDELPGRLSQPSILKFF